MMILFNPYGFGWLPVYIFFTLHHITYV